MTRPLRGPKSVTQWPGQSAVQSSLMEEIQLLPAKKKQDFERLKQAPKHESDFRIGPNWTRNLTYGNGGGLSNTTEKHIAISMDFRNQKMM